MIQHILALLIGFALDMLFGDPPALPHPVRLIGRFISACERILYREDAGPGSQRACGTVLVIIVVGISTACTVFLLWLCGLVNIWFAAVVEGIICYWMLAAKQLKVESMSVYDTLVHGTLDEARQRVSMIVGRDTEELDERGVAQAAVETIAENTSDGVVAPLFYMALFGAAGGVFYKAVNTLDSMVGYKNEKYRYFGTAAARLDDVLNWIPARLSGVLMCISACFLRMDGAGAWRIFLRDRLQHASPNSAQTEAACAGALGVQLGGSHYYFGKLVEKPTIGDDLRPICAEDILKANKLLYMTALLGLVVSLALAWCVMLAWEAFV